MKKLALVFLICFLNLFAAEFKVASYNVENLFDLEHDGTEYKEYIPHTKYWNKNSYKNKLESSARVVNHLDAQILALQEIESQKVFNALKKQTNYKYGTFAKKKTASVGVGLLSDFPLKKIDTLDVDRFDKYSRYILKAKIDINGIPLVVYVNHWRSKRAPESSRVKYALALKNDIDDLPKGQDYIVLGDLNSNYDEFVTFKYDKKLNDTFGITGINHILNTIKNKNLVEKPILLKNGDTHYNLWLELEKKERFSSKFRNRNNTPDNILISDELFDNRGIYYVNNSFNVFKPEYLYDRYIKRWSIRGAKGYSDHLPVFAAFSTKKQNYDIVRPPESKKITKIDQLYTMQTLQSNVLLKDVIVLYRTKKTAVVKQPGNRAIAVYKPPKGMKEGFVYNIGFNKIDSYFGLKEIKSIYKLKEVSKFLDYKKLYKNPESIDLFDPKNQNEIVTDLKGVYKKGHLVFTKNGEDKKIKLYFKKGIKKPEPGAAISISSGHLGVYRSNIQIIIHRQNDFAAID